MMSDGGVEIVFEYVGSSNIIIHLCLDFFCFIKLFMVYMYLIISIIGIIPLWIILEYSSVSIAIFTASIYCYIYITIGGEYI